MINNKMHRQTKYDDVFLANGGRDADVVLLQLEGKGFYAFSITKSPSALASKGLALAVRTSYGTS